MIKHSLSTDLVRRTHTCGVLDAQDVGKEVILCGWVRRRRDHGGLIFIDLGDYSGVSQIVFTPEDSESFKLAERLRSEYVVGVRGKVEHRPEGTLNPDMKSGAIEVRVSELVLFSESETPPFSLHDEADVKEEVRLRYRFLDLRRQRMQDILRLRHRATTAAREYLDQNGFCDVETPILSKPTPEGARDFLVPSRLSQGEFYALPQSPQLFKQVLMCAGIDRYYQIARCFRDEDLRANRQPEFSQIDIEVSFADEEIIRTLLEGLISAVWQKCLGVTVATPIEVIDYDYAMDNYGVDAPDLRFDLLIKDVSSVFSQSSFQVFRTTLERGGVIRGICLNGGSNLSRKELDELTEFVKIYDAKGLAWIKFEADGIKSSFSKFSTEGEINQITEKFEASSGDIVFLVADNLTVVRSSLGALRVHLANRFDLIEPGQFRFVWVNRFPLFDYDASASRYVSLHHPFTCPLIESDQDLERLEKTPGELKARAYDLVLNGQEIAGGSIRIHQVQVQQKVFSHLGINEEEARRKFGFLLEALSFGAPPHGGIAVGLDRLIMILANTDSIREVIAFPKTQKGVDLFVNSPSEAGPEQLVELGLKLTTKR
jgi:aspartyl-tRNA synthetase